MRYHISFGYKYTFGAISSVAFVDCDIKEVHKNDIRPGDTIMWHDGRIRTVCRSNITYDRFLGGQSLFGDSFLGGHQMVKKVFNLKIGNTL